MKDDEHIQFLNETIKELHKRNRELIAIIKEDNSIIKKLLNEKISRKVHGDKL